MYEKMRRWRRCHPSVTRRHRFSQPATLEFGLNEDGKRRAGSATKLKSKNLKARNATRIRDRPAERRVMAVSTPKKTHPKQVAVSTPHIWDDQKKPPRQPGSTRRLIITLLRIGQPVVNIRIVRIHSGAKRVHRAVCDIEPVGAKTNAQAVGLVLQSPALARRP